MNKKTLLKILKNNQNVSETMLQMLNNQRIHYLEFSLMNLTMNATTWLEMVNEPSYQEVLKKEALPFQVVGSIRETITKSLILHPSKEVAISHIKALLTYKEHLKSYVEVLIGYSDQLNAMEYMMNRKEARFKKVCMSIEEDEAFCGRLLQFIFKNDNHVLINEKIKQVIAQLPIRMTKNKFLDYIEQSLDRYKSGELKVFENYIQNIKDTIAPVQIHGYGQYFKEIFNRLEVLLKIDIESISKETYLFITEEILWIADKIKDSMSLYLLTVDLINDALGVLYSIKTLDETIEERPSICKGLKVLSLLQNQSISGFTLNTELKAALHTLEGEFERILDNIKDYNECVSLCLNSHTKAIQQYNFEEIFNDIECLDLLQSSNQFALLDEEDSSNCCVDEIILAKAKRQMNAFIKQQFDTKSRFMIRAIISSVLSLLPVFFKSPEEIYTYSTQALLNCRDKDEKQASKLLINQIIEEYDV